ncbi:hypothetical protein GCM10009535_49280 [Streptomyces thermocarboxydovorans]|uniref:Uncharacterized protein n=1 Tax=Streptomyces thermocarboxydovorans TaxID=59298 RepID=A0ABN1HRC3_9ACTN
MLEAIATPERTGAAYAMCMARTAQDIAVARAADSRPFAARLADGMVQLMVADNEIDTAAPPAGLIHQPCGELDQGRSEAQPTAMTMTFTAEAVWGSSTTRCRSTLFVVSDGEAYGGALSGRRARPCPPGRGRTAGAGRAPG